ncbi:MAG: hypothetical protein HY680_08300 [Chloroflexi bacterium]|nr:hypothetical protein [Chloroflexota bacterium]
MASRNTTTGAVLEEMVLPALRRGGYTIVTQAYIGQRLGGGRHRVDVLAQDSLSRKWIISLKWQQVSGTAEQKVPFEAICLADALVKGVGEYQGAYIVLGGNGWKLRDFYVGGGLKEYLNYGDKVKIVTLENFVAIANQGRL